MAGKLNLLKLSVGTEDVGGLLTWQRTVIQRNQAAGFGPTVTHTTRMWPRREAELLDGGSIYWVIKGVVLCRQPLLGLEERIGADGIRRCAVVLDPQMRRTRPQPRRAFQGWRYLDGADAPSDLAPGESGQPDLPPALQTALAEIGLC
ncbi:MAG: DUF1489 domain-containing protein [Pseudomonadota bacterium]